MMDKEEKKKEIFDEIEMQINKMDNKAGLLISAVGIVFYPLVKRQLRLLHFIFSAVVEEYCKFYVVPVRE